MSKKKPVLSIGMIFKNDIRSLERCMKALEPLRKAVPCELVMADTGSTDGSRIVAEQYADLLFDFPWVNDFSAARNAVIERCSGMWYLTVDCDEYLDPDISELKRYVTAPKGKYPAYGGVIQRNYRTLEMKAGDYSDFLAIRLMRMDTGSRYRGTIHEMISDLLPGETVCALSSTILHHDGYALDDVQKHQKKLERNLILLRAELEKEPNSPRRLLQCIESSLYQQEEREGYIRRAMELLQQTSDDELAKQPMCAHLYSQSVCHALTFGLPEAEEWLAWGDSHMADSIVFRVDVCANAAMYFYQKNDISAALTWAERYRLGCKAYDDGQYQMLELSVSSLACTRQYSRNALQILESDCLITLGRQEDAVKLLTRLDQNSIMQDAGQMCRYLQVLSGLTDYQAEAQSLSTKLLQMLWAPFKSKPTEAEAAERAKLRYGCGKMAVKLFAERKYWLFVDAPESLGIAARSMSLKDPKAITAALAEIEQWKEIPSETLVHAIQCGAAFPENFYAQGGETLRDFAVVLGKRNELIPLLPQWPDCDNLGGSIHRAQFVFELVAAELRSTDWITQFGLEQLCDLFEYVSNQYLSALYHPEIVANENTWRALPGMHGFALYLLAANKALRQEDELTYVKELRLALNYAPAMKAMAKFLLEHLNEQKRKNASPQLLALADQVREILAQYPLDDPAVAVLKQSEAYQTVAWMIEGMEPSIWNGFLQ